MSIQSWSIRRLLAGLTLVILACCGAAGVMTAAQWQSAKSAQSKLAAQLTAKTDVDRLAVLAQSLQSTLISAQYVPGVGETVAPTIKAGLDEVAQIQQREQAAGLPTAQATAIDRVAKSITGYVTWSTSSTKITSKDQLAEATKKWSVLNTEQIEAVKAGQAMTDANTARQVADVRQAMNRLVLLLAGFIAGMGAILPLLLNLFGRRLTRRVKGLAEALQRVATGDLTVRVPADGRDEISQMGASVNQAAERIADVFASVNNAAGKLASNSTALQEVAVNVARSAQEASGQAAIVARAADEVSQNVQSVAAGSEEMGSSISEIARSANEAALVATHAVRAVESTTGRMSKLGESSREIGDVVRLITSIAEQTNLLALNATIEAARAGDAGKGFAVVADEVKQLAQETARATEDISRRVETIQGDADHAAQAISEIAGVISQINEFQTTIASSVEEQTATTQEINHGVNDAATSSRQIASSISGVASSAERTADSMGRAQTNAQELSRLSEELTGLLAGFRLS